MTNIQLSRPADLVGVIPDMLGFTPEDSIVVVALNGSRVLVTARFEIENLPHVAEYAHRMIVDAQDPAFIVVTYTEIRDDDIARQATNLLLAEGWPVLGVATVHEGMIYTLATEGILSTDPLHPTIGEIITREDLRTAVAHTGERRETTLGKRWAESLAARDVWLADVAALPVPERIVQRDLVLSMLRVCADSERPYLAGVAATVAYLAGDTAYVHLIADEHPLTEQGLGRLILESANAGYPPEALANVFIATRPEAMGNLRVEAHQRMAWEVTLRSLNLL